MKKLGKLSVFLITLFLGTSIVQAARTCEGVSFKATDKFAGSEYVSVPGWGKYGSGIYFRYGTNSVDNISQFTFKDAAGNSLPGYCRNVEYSDGKYNDDQTYSCKSVVFNPNSANGDKKYYEAGIIAILKTANTQNSNLNFTNTSAEAYVSRLIAMRVFEMFWADLNTNGDVLNDNHQYNSHKIYAQNLINNSATKQKILTAIGKTTIPSLGTIGKIRSYTIGWNAGNGSDWNIENHGITDNMKKDVQKLVEIALDEAIAYRNGTKKVANVTWNKTPLKSSKPAIKDVNGITQYETTLTYNFNVENFGTPSDNTYLKLDFSCENCAEKGVSYEVVYNNRVFYTEPKLLSLAQSNDNKLEVKIIFKSTSSTYNCEDLNYKLDIEYKDESVKMLVYNMYSTASKCASGDCQNFYVVANPNAPINETIEGELALCTMECFQAQKLCEKNGDVKACKIYNETYGGFCGCTSSLTNPPCSDSETEIDFKEGYEGESTVCENPSEDNLNILNCVINNKDQAGNSYEATEIIDNNYCSVWCKEDYHFVMPGNKEASTGRYFTLKSSIKGTKTCYTSKIDKSAFETDYEKAREEVINAYNEYALIKGAVEAWVTDSSFYYSGYNTNGTVSTYYNDSNVSCSGGICTLKSGKIYNSYDKYNPIVLISKRVTLNSKISKLNSILDNYNSCSDWVMKYDFNPTINFWYEESYMNSAKINDTLTTNGTISKSDVQTSKCTGDTNDSYDSCSTGWTTADTKKGVSKFICEKDGIDYSCGYKTIYITQTQRVKQSITASGDYITPTQFYTLYPTGTIAIASPGMDLENASELTNALPIGLGTNQGVYNYTLKVKNLGEFYDSDKLGRIWNDKDNVISTVLKEKDACFKDGALQDKLTVGDKNFDKGVYVCVYDVDCPDCPVIGPPPYKIPDCPDGDCPVIGPPPIVLNGNLKVNYRPITSNDINPNDRDLGNNWKYDDSISTGLELKAYATTEEITSFGDSIYDINFDNPDDNDYALKVIMDSTMISEIRKYNDRYEDTVGYANNSLKCYDHNNSNDGKTYKNVYCYSTFIDELLYNNKTKNNIKISKNRIIGKTSEESNNLRKVKTQSSGYWTTWSEANSAKWTVTTEHGLAYYKTNYKSIGIGPSWK